MKTIRFTICLLGLIVGLSVLSFGQCQNQECKLSSSTKNRCFQCASKTGVACTPAATTCPQTCTETICATKATLVCDISGVCCDPETGICTVLNPDPTPVPTVGSLQELKLQPRVLDRAFLAAIRPASGPQCGSADLPRNVLFSL